FCWRAASSSFSSLSVMPVTAECTTSTCAPVAPRFFTTAAMFFQLASDETLVPPNLRTTQAECARVTSETFEAVENRAPEGGRIREWSGTSPKLQLVFGVDVVQAFLQILLELAIG